MSARPLRLGLTARGSALLTAGITALVCGVALGQRDLVRVALLLVAAPLVAAVVVNRSRLSVASSRSVTPERAAAGQQIIVRVAVRNDALLPTGALMLEDRLPKPSTQRARFTLASLRGREERSLAYRLPVMGRGRYRVGPLSMRLADPFGLVERTRSFAAVSEVLVLPKLDILPDLALPGGWDSAHQAGSHSVGSHGSDDASIRGYRYGDDLRKVHWRSTARLGSMMVRQEERPWHGRTTLLLDTRAGAHRRLPAGPDDDPREVDSFEWAVSATASIAQYLHQKGRPLDVVIGSTKIAARHPGAVLDQLATVELSEEGNLQDAMAVADAAGPDATMIALFGTLDERSLHAATSRHRPAGSALALLIDSPSWTSRSRIGVREQTRPAEVALTAAGWRVQRVSAHTAIGEAWAELVSGRTTPSSDGDGSSARERAAQYAGARAEPSGPAADDPSLSPAYLSPTPAAAGDGHRS